MLRLPQARSSRFRSLSTITRGMLTRDLCASTRLRFCLRPSQASRNKPCSEFNQFNRLCLGCHEIRDEMLRRSNMFIALHLFITPALQRSAIRSAGSRYMPLLTERGKIWTRCYKHVAPPEQEPSIRLRSLFGQSHSNRQKTQKSDAPSSLTFSYGTACFCLNTAGILVDFRLEFL